MFLPTRRIVLAGLSATLVGGAASAPPIGTFAPPTGKPEPGLHARAMRKGLFFGAVVDNISLRTEPAVMARVAAECGMLGAEGAFRWAELQARPEHFSFEHADMLLAFAARHAMRVRGSPLIWHRAQPAWLEAALTGGKAEQVLAHHVARVGGHFRGRLAQWDVVKDPLRLEDGKPRGMRDGAWLRALGGRFPEIAFAACAAADPGALRVLSQEGLDYGDAGSERRRGALLELLAGMKAEGVPVQAVGLQGHLEAGRRDFDQGKFAKFCADVAGLELKIIVTELRVDDRGLPGSAVRRDAAVAAHARAWLDAVLVCPAVVGVVCAGLTDRRSVLHEQAPRPDGRPQRPHPLGTDLRRKPLWQALAAGFDMAPGR
jgi:endo-1,4-beta-xylanase